MTDLVSSHALKPGRRIIISISSDIGIALAHAWLDRGHTLVGTYRNDNANLDTLRARGATLVPCDLADATSVDNALRQLASDSADWDVVVVASGTLEPVGPFLDHPFDAWESSFNVNLMAPLRMVHGLMPARRAAADGDMPTVLFFAGSGSNGPAPNFSAYTLAKVASIKLVELLDSEIPDTRFAILGPGWVRTKIHDAVLAAGERAGSNHQRTRQMLDSDTLASPESVVVCCDWIINSPHEAIGGRNISLAHDAWREPALIDKLKGDANMYKLRRAGSDAADQPGESAAGAAHLLAGLMEALPALAQAHAPNTSVYNSLSAAARAAVEPLFGPGPAEKHSFGPFGPIVFPYRSMGAVDSLDLFGLDELIILAFYWANRNNYRKAADVGANIGLHSLTLAKCGFEVRSFEPDPKHVAMLNETLSSNGADKVKVFSAAVSDKPGEAEFLRVLGNTTGSHLAGAKGQAYGEIDRFVVPLVPISEIIEWADLIKIDAEGHEANIILATTAPQWDGTDAMMEIGSDANARAIFDHCSNLGVNVFTQKTGWARANGPNDLPTSYKEGSAFLSRKPAMPGMHVK